MSTYEPCVLGSDGNCTRWSHDHAADRPSVTDNARAERQRSEYTVQETAAYFAGRIQRLADRMREDDYRRSMTDVVALGSVQAFLDRIARDDFDVFAAGRAETTTATTEDAEAAVVDALGQSPFAHHEVIPSGETASTLYITHDDEWSELASLIVQMLASRGLLATARTLPTEDAEEVLHGAGWFARADLDPRDLRGILHDLADAGLLRGGDE